MTGGLTSSEGCLSPTAEWSRTLGSCCGGPALPFVMS